MNLSIHLALTLNVNFHIFIVNVMSLSSLVIFQNEIKISNGITNPRPKYSEDSSDQTKQKICNCQQSCLLFLIQEVFLLYTQ